MAPTRAEAPEQIIIVADVTGETIAYESRKRGATFWTVISRIH